MLRGPHPLFVPRSDARATPEPAPGNAGEGKRDTMSATKDTGAPASGAHLAGGAGLSEDGIGGRERRRLQTVVPAPVDELTPLADFPASERVLLADPQHPEIRVPVRRIHLSQGEPPVDVYDTFGPRAADPRQGLPKLRQAWI